MPQITDYFNTVQSVANGTGSGTWANPAFAQGAPDGLDAVFSGGGSDTIQTSDWLRFIAWAGELPASLPTPTGILVEIYFKNAQLLAGATPTVQLVVGNVGVGTPKTISMDALGYNYLGWFGLGGELDLWGLSSLSYTHVNDGQFGFQFSVVNNDGETWEIDSSRATVYWAGDKLYGLPRRTEFVDTQGNVIFESSRP